MDLPPLTDSQRDAAVLARAIEIVSRIDPHTPQSWVTQWYLKLLARQLAR